MLMIHSSSTTLTQKLVDLHKDLLNIFHCNVHSSKTNNFAQANNSMPMILEAKFCGRMSSVGFQEEKKIIEARRKSKKKRTI